jgi:hypothetical protein
MNIQQGIVVTMNSTKELVDACEARAAVCRGRAEKATEGPWETATKGSPWYSGQFAILAPMVLMEGDTERDGPAIFLTFNGNLNREQMKLDNDFISHSRTDVPELASDVDSLCAVVREQGKTIEQLTVELDALCAITTDERKDGESVRDFVARRLRIMGAEGR